MGLLGQGRDRPPTSEDERRDKAAKRTRYQVMADAADRARDAVAYAAKQARHEAKVVATDRPREAATPGDRTVARAVGQEPPRDARAGLLSQPILVFLGTHRSDFQVFDQEGATVGSVVRVSVPRPNWHSLARPPRWELRDIAGQCLVSVEQPEDVLRHTFIVCRSDGTRAASVSPPTVGVSRVSWAISAEEGSEESSIGFMRRPHVPTRDLRFRCTVENAHGAEVAHMIRKGKDLYVTRIEEMVTEPLRTVVLVASMVWDDSLMESSALGGGG